MELEYQTAVVVDAVSLCGSVPLQSDPAAPLRDCIMYLVQQGIHSIKAFAPSSFCTTDSLRLMVNQGLLFVTPPNVEDYIIDYADRRAAFIVTLRSFTEQVLRGIPPVWISFRKIGFMWDPQFCPCPLAMDRLRSYRDGLIPKEFINSALQMSQHPMPHGAHVETVVVPAAVAPDLSTVRRVANSTGAEVQLHTGSSGCAVLSFCGTNDSISEARKQILQLSCIHSAQTSSAPAIQQRVGLWSAQKATRMQQQLHHYPAQQPLQKTLRPNSHNMPQHWAGGRRGMVVESAQPFAVQQPSTVPTQQQQPPHQTAVRRHEVLNQTIDKLTDSLAGAALGRADLLHDDLATNMHYCMRLGKADLQHDDLEPVLEEHLKLGQVELYEDDNTNVNHVLGPNLGLRLSLESPWQQQSVQQPRGGMDLDDL